MARIQIEDLSPVESLSAEEIEEIFGAGRKSFHPELLALQTREMMDAGIGQSLLPVGPALAGQQRTYEQRPAAPLDTVMQVDYGQLGTTAATTDAPRGASLADPLEKFHRQYVGLKDLRKGDILLNTTKGLTSESIQFFGGSKFNHAAVYVGNGMVVEAVGGGVRLLHLKEFLQDDHIVRTMVVRNDHLNDSQRDSIASFAIDKVGKPYNFVGLAPQLLKMKSINIDQFQRENYFCSQLVAAAYRSADVRIHHYSIDLSPGDLAARAGDGVYSAVGAIYDGGYHRSVREGRDVVNVDVTGGGYQPLLHDAYRDRVGTEFRGLRVERLTVDSSGMVRAYLIVQVREVSKQYEIHINNRDGSPMDAWTANLCRQIYDKHFGGTPDAATPSWVVERAVGLAVTNQLNKTFAGKALDGQKIDRFELVRADSTQGHLFEVDVRVWLNNGTQTRLRVSVHDGGLGQRDFSCGRIEASGDHQFSDQSLAQVKEALKFVPVDSATRLQVDTVRRAVLDELNKAFAGQSLDGKKVDRFMLGSVDGGHRYEYKARVEVWLNNGAAKTTLVFTLRQGLYEGKCDLHCVGVTEPGDHRQFTDGTLAQMKDVLRTLWVDASDVHGPLTPQDMQFVQKKSEQLLQDKVLNQLDRSGRKSPDAIVVGSSVSLWAEDQIAVTFQVKYNTTRYSTTLGDVPDRTSAVGTISLHFKAVWKGDQLVYEILLPSLNNLDKGPHVNWEEVGKKLQELCANHTIKA